MPIAKPEPIRRVEFDIKTETGNSQFRGNGILRSCIKCGKHKPSEGGRYIKIAGSRHWVCPDHPLKAKP